MRPKYLFTYSSKNLLLFIVIYMYMYLCMYVTQRRHYLLRSQLDSNEIHKVKTFPVYMRHKSIENRVPFQI